MNFAKILDRAGIFEGGGTIIGNHNIMTFQSVRRLKRVALVVTTLALILSIHITISLIPMVAYGLEETTINNVKINSATEKYTSEIKTKASVDKVGIQGTKIGFSKSKQEAEEVLKNQVVSLEKARAEEKAAEQVLQAAQQKEIANNLTKIAALRIQMGKDAITAKEKSSRKMVVQSQSVARGMDIRTASNWEASDFEAVVPNEVKDLIPVAIRMEKELGISSLYLVCVGINETGWGKRMSGKHNFFNWTNDGINHFSFNSMDSFAEFSIKSYKASYLNPEFYTERLGYTPDKITMESVNVRYAVNMDGSVNWKWTATVSQLMKKLSDERMANSGK